MQTKQTPEYIVTEGSASGWHVVLRGTREQCTAFAAGAMRILRTHQGHHVETRKQYDDPNLIVDTWDYTLGEPARRTRELTFEVHTADD